MFVLRHTLNCAAVAHFENTSESKEEQSEPLVAHRSVKIALENQGFLRP